MAYDPATVVIITIVNYLLGGISFSRIISKRASPDLHLSDAEIDFVDSEEKMQIGHIGANVVAQEIGAKWGIMVGMLDILKVAIPSFAIKMLFPELPYYMLLAGIAGMAGHNWPIYYRFEGGMGFSPAMGSLLVVDWLAIFMLPITGTLIGLILRNMVVASLSWLWLLIPWMWFRTFDWGYLVYAVALNLLFLLAMIPEIKRAVNYWKEGKLQEYGESMLMSNPMGRGMIKMASFFRFSPPPE